MKYITRLLLLGFCVYAFILCAFYLHDKVQWVFREKNDPRQPDRHEERRRNAHQPDTVTKSRDLFLQPMTLKASTRENRPKKCQEKRNFVFVKCMKCATETMETIFRRFGFSRDLAFVLPIEQRISLGWPYLMEPGDYNPPRVRPSCPQCQPGYNILCEHAIYNRTFMRRLMPPDTVYITIIRQPYNRLVSTFRYFKIGQKLNISEDDISKYLINYRRYESIYKSPNFSHKRVCIPNNFSLTENLMSHCLGMPLGFPANRESIGSDPDAINKYIETLDKDFSLVMLVEYFHESLILLRRLMCWTFKDIIYKKVNMITKRGNEYLRPETRKMQEELYKTYSPIDYALYDHFNRTFWEKVSRQPDGFYDEVRHFEKVHKNVSEFCLLFGRNFTPNRTYIVPSSRWNIEFTFTTDDCYLISCFLLGPIHEQYIEQMKGKYEESVSKTNREFC